MNEDLRQLILAFGRCLISLAGEENAPVQTMPAAAPAPKRKYVMPPRKEIDWICQDCDATFKTKSKLAKRCPKCRYVNSIGKLGKLTAKKNGEPQPAPVADGKIRCERMHATIPATMCGTREECRGCKVAGSCARICREERDAD